MPTIIMTSRLSPAIEDPRAYELRIPLNPELPDRVPSLQVKIQRVCSLDGARRNPGTSPADFL
jgi:hypothetical protein